MPNTYFMGIDQGTTGTMTIIFDEELHVHGAGYRTHRQIYPSPGCVEHDAEEIVDCVLETAKDALGAAGIGAGRLRSIGIANQGETVVAWNRRTGKQVHNAIVWQDRRTVDIAERIDSLYGEVIRERAGLPVSSYFSATKLMWLLEREDIQGLARRGDLLAGTLDSYLFWRLTGQCVTDASTASRTMLMNLYNLQWDEEILRLLDIPVEILPEIRGSAELGCRTRPDVFFGSGIPVTGGLVDQQAALLGQGCVIEGAVKTTYGTGCFMLANIGEKAVPSSNGLLTTVAWKIDGRPVYALDAGVYTAGAAVSWLQNGLRIAATPDGIDSMAGSVPDNGGVYFVPAFSGLAAPYWDEYARGAILGLSPSSTAEHVARAALESIAFQVADNFDLMRREVKLSSSCMRVDGGMVKSDFLMQFQADLLGIPVDIPEISESTALGAAFIGALGVGVFDHIGAIGQKWRRKKQYEPKMDAAAREELLAYWHEAVARSKNWRVFPSG